MGGGTIEESDPMGQLRILSVVGSQEIRCANALRRGGICAMLALFLLAACADSRPDVTDLGPTELALEVRAALAEPIRLSVQTRSKCARWYVSKGSENSEVR